MKEVGGGVGAFCCGGGVVALAGGGMRGPPGDGARGPGEALVVVGGGGIGARGETVAGLVVAACVGPSLGGCGGGGIRIP